MKVLVWLAPRSQFGFSICTLLLGVSSAFLTENSWRWLSILAIAASFIAMYAFDRLRIIEADAGLLGRAPSASVDKARRDLLAHEDAAGLRPLFVVAVLLAAGAVAFWAIEALSDGHQFHSDTKTKTVEQRARDAAGSKSKSGAGGSGGNTTGHTSERGSSSKH
jgi:hypothetical protein